MRREKPIRWPWQDLFHFILVYPNRWPLKPEMPTSPAKIKLSESELISAAMSALGKRRSKAKSAAARRNGLLGGSHKTKKKAAR